MWFSCHIYKKVHVSYETVLYGVSGGLKQLKTSGEEKIYIIYLHQQHLEKMLVTKYTIQQECKTCKSKTRTLRTKYAITHTLKQYVIWTLRNHKSTKLICYIKSSDACESKTM